MNRHSAFAVAFAASATAVLGLVATPATGVTLQQLIDTGDSFIVGEKKFTFDRCDIVTGGAGLATPFSCNDIEVTPIIGEHTGFRLQSIFGAINTSLIDVLVEYTLEGVNPGKLFSGAKLQFNGDGNPDGGFITNVTEQFTDYLTGEVIGQINVTNPPPVFVDEIAFVPPVSKLHISKDIGLAAFITPSQANISFVDQTFKHVPVPEPGTVGGLLAISSIGIGAMLKRHRKQSNKLDFFSTPDESDN
ncbi:MAG TPA: hypothetical protein DCL61_18970 [Cyanobacteria bacterium UBA12227]|nr:hypothetical protein [Cyanobacteria bacterium UBA12227]HAX86657.1 hypothetical protein [Cyanobacteria bacterium UBA11370]HBY77667.1 hypothetical protein [Cyanobacteria bacterium UBA11148]